MNIFNAYNAYVKSICYMNISCDNTNVTQFAQSVGMSLYSVVTELDLASIIAFSKATFGNPTVQSVRINGVYSEVEAKWFVNNPNKTAVYAKAIGYRTVHNCLRINANQTAGVFHVAELNCSKTLNAFFEYKLEPASTTVAQTSTTMSSTLTSSSSAISNTTSSTTSTFPSTTTTKILTSTVPSTTTSSLSANSTFTTSTSITTTKITSSTSTATQATTSICTNMTDVFDSSGIYKKTICFYAVGQTYPEVLLYAEAYKMRLFASTNDYEFSSGVDFMKKVFVTNLQAQIRINGNYTTNGWIIYNSTVLVHPRNVTYRDGSNCLQFTGVNGAFNIVPFVCSSPIYAFFEFVRA